MSRRWKILRGCTGLFCALLLAMTWRLWIPVSEFPVIPLFAGIEIPFALECLLSVLLMCAAFALLYDVGRERSRWWAAAILLMLSSSWLVNQHRIQAWAVHLAVVSFLLAMSRADHGFRLLRVFTASVYVFSAVSKLDFTFVNSFGQTLAGGLFDAVWLSFGRLSDSSKWLTAAALPVGELLVAVGLISRRLRRFAVLAAAVMHTALILALSPLGLNHSYAVLIWNVYCALVVVLAFWPQRHLTEPLPDWVPTQDDTSLSDTAEDTSLPRPARASASSRLRDILRFPVGLAIAIVSALPVLELEPFEIYDHWPAWALYSTRHERINVFVHTTVVDQLPEHIREHVEPPAPLQHWCRVRIDRWSVDEVDGPIYPEDRFQIGVALAIAEHCKPEHLVQVQIDGPANRLTGERETKTLEGHERILEHARSFRLNAEPPAEPQRDTM